MGTQYCMQRDAFTKFAPPGYRVRYWDLNSGGEAIRHMRDGTLQVSVIGSAPTAFAVAMELPVASVGMANIIGVGESLVVRKGIVYPHDLHGTVLATPFGSTAHFELVQLLRVLHITNVTVVHGSVPELMQLYDDNKIDGVYAWEPALTHVLTNGGRTFSDSALLSNWGYPIFNGILANRDFAAAHPAFMKSLIQVWDACTLGVQQQSDDPAVIQAVGSFMGWTKEVTEANFKSFILEPYVTAAGLTEGCEYLSCGENAGLGKAIRASMNFYVEQKRLTSFPTKLANYVDPDPAAAAAADVIMWEDIAPQLAQASDAGGFSEFPAWECGNLASGRVSVSVYPRPKECQWRLNGDYTLTLEDVHLLEGYDFLIIEAGGEVVAKVTGKHAPGSRRFAVSGSIVVSLFVSGEPSDRFFVPYIPRHGVTLVAAAGISCSACVHGWCEGDRCVCQPGYTGALCDFPQCTGSVQLGNLSARTTIKSGAAPTYLPGQECSWTVSLDAGQVLSIDFVAFSLHEPDDYLEFTVDGEVKFKVSGTGASPIAVAGSEVTLTFAADMLGLGAGFELELEVTLGPAVSTPCLGGVIHTTAGSLQTGYKPMQECLWTLKPVGVNQRGIIITFDALDVEPGGFDALRITSGDTDLTIYAEDPGCTRDSQCGKGNCVDGQCVCPPMFTNRRCGTPSTLELISTSVEVLWTTDVNNLGSFSGINMSFRASSNCEDNCNAPNGQCKFEVCECLPQYASSPTCAADDSSDVLIIVVIIISVVVALNIIVFGALARRTSAGERSMRKLLTAVALAENTAESITEMEFEKVKYLYEIEKPTRLQAAFIKMVDTLEMYKAYLPKSVLPAHLCDDGVDNDLLAVAAFRSSGDDHQFRVLREATAHSVPADASSSPRGSDPPESAVDSIEGIGDSVPTERVDRGESRDRGHRKSPQILSPRLAFPRYQMTQTAVRMTLLVLNVNGTTDMIRGDIVDFTELFSRVVDTALVCATARRGMVDLFQGERLYLSFNASRRCATHITASGDVALDLSKDLRCDLNIGLVTGMAYCGDMGSMSMRRFNIVGALLCDLVGIERAGHIFGVRVIVNSLLFSQAQGFLSMRVMPRFVDVRGGGGIGTVAEIVGEVKHSRGEEWMYQMQAGSRAWEKYNKAAHMLISGAPLSTAMHAAEGEGPMLMQALDAVGGDATTPLVVQWYA
eukprot:Hpha_TRINITY_DN14681_c0_g1::TRINITY_DN14681_c0_g1_i2::g.47776::m.47776